MTEQGRRGRPRKVCSSGKQKVLGALIDEVVEIQMVEVSLERGSSLILFEARGSMRRIRGCRGACDDGAREERQTMESLFFR